MMFHFGSDASIPPGNRARHRERQPAAQVYVYAGAGHAFNRETDPAHHDPGNAALARTRPRLPSGARGMTLGNCTNLANDTVPVVELPLCEVRRWTMPTIPWLVLVSRVAGMVGDHRPRPSKVTQLASDIDPPAVRWKALFQARQTQRMPRSRNLVPHVRDRTCDIDIMAAPAGRRDDIAGGTGGRVPGCGWRRRRAALPARKQDWWNGWLPCAQDAAGLTMAADGSAAHHPGARRSGRARSRRSARKISRDD